MREMLQVLCEAVGVGGVGNISDVIASFVQPHADAVKHDALGNVVAFRRSSIENAPTLMLEAHLDEIGFVVTHVDDDGFLHVSSCGGIDTRVLAAAPVRVLTEPPMDGVFCSTPPHLQDKDSVLPSLTDMGIDVGLSAEAAKAAVSIGTRVAFSSPFRAVGDNAVCGKSLDNRAGCAAVITAFCELCQEHLPFHVVALFAVQEEIGGAGALTGAFATEPSIALVTDVSFAHTPDAPAHECGRLGQGPMVGVAPGLDRNLTELVCAVAEREGIAIQREAMGGRTGTDADHIQTSRVGVKTALLSIPQRYMHTPAELVDVRDVESTAKLMVLVAKEAMGVC